MTTIGSWLRHRYPVGSTGRWILSGIRASPVRFAAALARSILATWKLTGKWIPISVRIGSGQAWRVARASDSKVVLNGIIAVNPWGGDCAPSSISCGHGSTLEVSGDVEIGPGVHVEIGDGAVLRIGGRRTSTGSGFTRDCRIMVERKVEIGADSIVAWGVYISDSSWHDIQGAERCEPVTIGERVWISHDVSVMKGADIRAGCVIGAKSLVRRGVYPERSFIAGVPATVRKMDVEWSR